MTIQEQLQDKAKNQIYDDWNRCSIITNEIFNPALDRINAECSKDVQDFILYNTNILIMHKVIHDVRNPLEDSLTGTIN